METQGRKAKGLRYFNQNTMIAGCHILRPEDSGLLRCVSIKGQPHYHMICGFLLFRIEETICYKKDFKK